MRVAMVGPFGFHPNKTMRSRAFNLARALVDRGHQVRIVMPPWQTPAEAGKTWSEHGVEIRNVSLRGGLLGTLHRMVRETTGWQPDVVHGFKPKAYSGLVLWWLWQTRRRTLRLVLDTDDWEGKGGWNDLAPYTPLQKRFFAWQEQWGMRHCHALTTASLALKNMALNHGVPADRVIYLPNGPGIESQGEPLDDKLRLELAERPVLLLYSRLFEFDTNRLTAVLQGVKASVPDLAILAVGAGLYEADAAHFRQQLAQAGLLDHFIDVGWVELGQVPALLAAAGVGVYLMEDTLLNRTKCPVKLADMLMAGVPVVAEAVGQVPEYVLQNKTGLLRDSGDVAGLTADLILLLRDERERIRLSRNAQDHIRQNFGWSLLAQRAETAYLGRVQQA